MPRLPLYATMPVVYLFRRNPETGEIEGPGGTGVVVGRKSENFDRPHAYVVTNHHTILGGGSIIRVNHVEGGKLQSRFIEKDPSEWQFINGFDDLAAIDVTQDLIRGKDQISHVPEPAFVTLAWAKRLNIGIGDEVAMVGLFTGHSGGPVNVPIGRFGNIALIASEFSKIKQPNGAQRESFLVDMHSRTGFSGSPVWVYRNLQVEFAHDGSPQFPSKPDDFFMRLLGVQCAHFLDTIELKKADKNSDDAQEVTSVGIVEGDKLRIPGSVSVVVPAWRITELLNIPLFQTQRDQNDAHFEKEAGSIPAAESAPKNHQKSASPD